MGLKIRCDRKCEKFCKIFWKVNKAYFNPLASQLPSPNNHITPVSARRDLKDNVFNYGS